MEHVHRWLFNAAATGLALLLGATMAPGATQGGAATRAHVEQLAADELGGRLTGTPGAARAADYIVAELEKIGARPVPGADDFRLPFEFTSGIRAVRSELTVRHDDRVRAYDGGESLRPLSFSESGRFEGAVVFAGYGITTPDGAGYPYDSYATLDLQDKVVVVLRGMPEDVDVDARTVLARYTDPRYKAMRARELGAGALLMVTGPRSAGAGELMPLTFDAAAAGSGIVAGSIAGGLADDLFAAAGRPLEEIQAELDTGNPHVAGFDLAGVEVQVDIEVERQRSIGTNVVGYLPPSDTAAPAPRRPFVMLGAHYDHLGSGEGGSSLARDSEAGQVHNGADDNASGVAAVLEAGGQLATMTRDRGILLAFWSGEEFGLLGANAFADEGPIASDQLAAYLNFDMVGRVRDNVLTIQAVGSSELWPRLIERTNVPIGFDLRTQDDPWLPTDSTAFNRVGVPTLSFFSGTHPEYHSPRDDADLINYEGLDRVARFGALLARRVANEEAPPAFVAVAQSAPQGGPRGAGVFTGTIPDYAAEVEGLLLGGVIEGGPADEAGLREGDVIVELAGQEITNIYDYMYVLEALKIDEPVTVIYERDGERREAEMTPRARR